jgi:hypothetical protein
LRIIKPDRYRRFFVGLLWRFISLVKCMLCGWKYTVQFSETIPIDGFNKMLTWTLLRFTIFRSQAIPYFTHLPGQWQCKQCQCLVYNYHGITFRRTELRHLSTYLFRNSLVRITIQNTIQSVIFKLVSTDLHLLFRYFRISKFLVRASTGNRNWLAKQCCPSTRETSETTRNRF